MAEPFQTLGLIYQLQDDVVDLFGEKGRAERGADIAEGKVSALVVAHLRMHPEDHLWLVGVLRRRREDTSRELISEVIDRFDREGALDAVLSHIDVLVAEAQDQLANQPGLAAAHAALLSRILAPLQHLYRR